MIELLLGETVVGSFLIMAGATDGTISVQCVCHDGYTSQISKLRLPNTPGSEGGGDTGARTTGSQNESELSNLGFNKHDESLS